MFARRHAALETADWLQAEKERASRWRVFHYRITAHLGVGGTPFVLRAAAGEHWGLPDRSK
jgi:hypothetical protein